MNTLTAQAAGDSYAKGYSQALADMVKGGHSSALARDHGLKLVPVASSAIEDIAAERQRQIDAEGWTPEHDDEHKFGEMAAAAAAYAFSAGTTERYLAADPIGFWPWSVEWWRPSTPRRDLVKAGALIAAEIDRLDRLAARLRGDPQ